MCDIMTSQNIDLGTEEMRQNFASCYAYGVPLPECLLNAGYATKSLKHGLALLQEADVRLWIDEVREHITSQLAESKNAILNQLDRDRDFAYAKGNAAAAVSATMSKAKVMGLLDPDSTAKQPKRIIIDWEDDYLPPSNQGVSSQAQAEDNKQE